MHMGMSIYGIKVLCFEGADLRRLVTEDPCLNDIYSIVVAHITCILLRTMGKFFSKRNDVGSCLKIVFNFSKIFVYLCALVFVSISETHAIVPDSAKPEDKETV